MKVNENGVNPQVGLSMFHDRFPLPVQVLALVAVATVILNMIL